MLDGITTVGRKHGSILLRSTKPDTDIPVGDSLYISFEYHFIGYVVRIIITLIENDGVTFTEIRQCLRRPLISPCQHKVCFMQIRRMILCDCQIV